MTVRLSALILKWPTLPSPQEHQGTSILDITPFNTLDLHLTWEKLIAVREKFEADTEEDNNCWRERTIFTLACEESLFCMNFIPQDRTQDQVVQVVRSRDADEEDFETVFQHNRDGCTFILPVRFATRVYDLGKIPLADTIAALQIHPKSYLAKGLRRFVKDPSAKGIALTLQNLGACIWLKSDTPNIRHEYKVFSSTTLPYIKIGINKLIFDPRDEQDSSIRMECKEDKMDHLIKIRNQMMKIQTNKEKIHWTRIYYLALCCPSIKSISFYPANGNVIVLYVHKGTMLPTLCKTPIIHDVAIPLIKVPAHQGALGIDEPELKKAVETIHANFVQDRLTLNLAFTYQDGRKPLATRYWIK